MGQLEDTAKLVKALREEATNIEIDILEAALLDEAQLIDIPVKHTFTPKLYVREFFMPAGSWVNSRVHGTEHPFAVMAGSVLIYVPSRGIVRFKSGDTGVTTPGTRRASYVEEDCHWVTYHVLTDEEESLRVEGRFEELVDMIEKRIIIRRELPNSNGKTTYELYEHKLNASLEVSQ